MSALSLTVLAWAATLTPVAGTPYNTAESRAAIASRAPARFVCADSCAIIWPDIVTCGSKRDLVDEEIEACRAGFAAASLQTWSDTVFVGTYLSWDDTAGRALVLMDTRRAQAIAILSSTGGGWTGWELDAASAALFLDVLDSVFARPDYLNPRNRLIQSIPVGDREQ